MGRAAVSRSSTVRWPTAACTVATFSAGSESIAKAACIWRRTVGTTRPLVAEPNRSARRRYASGTAGPFVRDHHLPGELFETEAIGADDLDGAAPSGLILAVPSPQPSRPRDLRRTSPGAVTRPSRAHAHTRVTEGRNERGRPPGRWDTPASGRKVTSSRVELERSAVMSVGN
jgi:hypothetical protein